MVTYIYGLVLAGLFAAAGDGWPTYRHDAGRSAVAGESLSLPLRVVWRHEPAMAPAPSWHEPAKHDYWNRKHNLNPRVTDDRAFHVAVADGLLFYGSSASDQVYALDAGSGEVRWSFFAGGPVRLAPTAARGRVYFGSDDGRVYALRASDGRPEWHLRIGPDDRQLIGDGRMISRWPVRTGVAIIGEVGYAAAGIFPHSEGAFLVAFDADTGRQIWKRQIDRPAMGYLAASGDRLALPAGGASPGIYDRRDGRRLAELRGPGGTYLALGEDLVVTGPGEAAGELLLAEAQTGRKLMSLGGVHLVRAGESWFLHSRTALAAFDALRLVQWAQGLAERSARLAALKPPQDAQARAERAELDTDLAQWRAKMDDCRLWRVPCRDPYELVQAGSTLLAGGDGRVTAFDARDGGRLGSVAVDGRAYGLAVARGRLYVSTSQGTIWCLEPAAQTGASGASRASRASEAGDARELNRPNAASGPRPTAADSPSDGAPSPYPADAWTPIYQAAAERALAAAGARRGWCLVLDAGEGRLAYELARRSELHIVGVEPDGQKVAAARRALTKAGLYGRQVVVQEHTGPGLPFPPFFANLIVSEAALRGGAPGAPPDEVLRVLRPCGGVACLGQSAGAAATRGDPAGLKRWLAGGDWPGASLDLAEGSGLWGVVRRGPLPHGGQWTHGLADPGNTACSGDERVVGEMEVLWFGRPGPREMADRHHRNVPPLAIGGRLFIAGEDRILALDAYNGTELWRREVPEMLRLGAFLDSTNMVADESSVYVAVGDECQVFDAASGQPRSTLSMPQAVAGQQRHWGYLARAGDLVVGSGRRPGAAYARQSRQDCEQFWFDNMAVVASEYLFAVGRGDGKARWTYRDGLIPNTTIAIGDGRAYFVESRSPSALAEPLGRMTTRTFLDGPNYLVAVDLQTGRIAWRHEIDLADCRLIAYLAFAAGKLVLSGNRYVDDSLWYFFRAFDAASGREVWRRSHDAGFAPDGGHGEQNRIPTIVGDTVYAYPLAYKLHTGQAVEGWKFSRHGHGCGNISASAHALFWRGGNPWQWDLRPGGGPGPINRVTRPGCHVNIIPAAGVLLIPEASSGCTCPFPLQTSIAYVPTGRPLKLAQTQTAPASKD